MKTLIILILTPLFLYTSCEGQDKNTSYANSEILLNRIEIIDFHTTHRCKTCLKIESNTKNLLDSKFRKEMEENLLSFRLINIDKKENFDLAKKFQAGGTALFINLIENGNEQHIDITDFAFMKAFDDEKFASELELKIREQLKKL